MTATTDATTALLAAVRDAAGPGFVLKEVRSRRWASVTFAGSRHEVAFRIEGDGAAAAAAEIDRRLQDATISAPGHILADIAVIETKSVPGQLLVRVDALTVEDG